MVLAAKVKPGCKQPGISFENGTLVLCVRERALEGAANEACVRALCDVLGIGPSRIKLVFGARSRQKRFSIEGVDEAEVRKRLGADG